MLGPGSPLAARIFDTVIAATGEDIIVSARDITDRVSAERAHEAAEDRFRDVIESAPDAMVLVDSHGRITLINARAEELFGYRRDELLGHEHELLIPEPARVRHRDHSARYMANAQPRPMGAGLDLFARRKDGTQFPVRSPSARSPPRREQWSAARSATSPPVTGSSVSSRSAPSCLISRTTL